MGSTIALAEATAVEPTFLPEGWEIKVVGSAASDAPAVGGQLISADAMTGKVMAIVGVTGIVDHVKDLIEVGAYRDTLVKRRPKVCWAHDWEKPVGRVPAIEEWAPGDPRLSQVKATLDGKPWPREAGALVASMQFNLKSERGRESFAAVEFYSETGECEWSIGWQPIPSQTVRRKDGVRVCRKVELFEVSPVLFGAAPLTRTLEVKSIRLDDAYADQVSQLAGQPAGDAPDEGELHRLAMDEIDWAEVDAAATDTPATPSPTMPAAGGLAFDAKSLPGLDDLDALLSFVDQVAVKAGEGGADRNRGNADQLRRWYEEEEGAARIRWGQPGDFMRCVDIAGKHMDPERAKGYCFTGDTEFLTRDGVTTFADAVDTEQMVLTAAPPTSPNAKPVRGDGHWVSAPVRSYGEQRVLTVTLARNKDRKVIRATPEHVWFASTSNRSAARNYVREFTTADLRAGMALAALMPMPTWLRTSPSPFGVAAGFTFGDGHREAGKGARVDLWGEKDASLLPYFQMCGQSQVKTQGGVLGVRVSGLPGSWKSLPTVDEGHAYLLGWLAGYFAADGTVTASGGLVLYSANRAHLEHAVKVATRLGISTYGIRTARRRGYGAEDSDLHCVNFVRGTVPPTMLLVPEHRRRFTEASGVADAVRWRVESVEDHGEVEEVFCAEVPETRTFALADQVWVHNCNLRHHGALGVYAGQEKTAGVAAAEQLAKTWNPLLEVGAAAAHTERKMMSESGLTGSFEQRAEKLRDALTNALRELNGWTPTTDTSQPVPDDNWVSIEGTWDNRVVATYVRYAPDRMRQTYQVPYRWNGSEIQLGDPQPVELQVTVVPTAGATVSDVAEAVMAPAMDGLVTAAFAVKTALGRTEIKAGRVLSEANASRLRAALEHLLDVARAAGIDLPGWTGDAPTVIDPDTTPDTTAPTEATAYTVKDLRSVLASLSV